MEISYEMGYNSISFTTYQPGCRKMMFSVVSVQGPAPPPTPQTGPRPAPYNMLKLVPLGPHCAGTPLRHVQTFSTWTKRWRLSEILIRFMWHSRKFFDFKRIFPINYLHSCHNVKVLVDFAVNQQFHGVFFG